MSKQTINIGASPNDGTGTPLRTSFDYTNQNFTELYTALGGGVGLPGATTQVIFNDGGTNLAGDAGLVYNKTTDTLTAGNATITGAATVGTTLGVTGVSTLASAVVTGALTSGTTTLVSHAAGYTGKVGIGTATPSSLLTLNQASGAYSLNMDGGGYGTMASFGVVNVGVNNNAYIGTVGNNDFLIQVANSTRATFDQNGHFNLANGNVVMTTSGKGIDFAATSGTGTSELLADYEEGTWTIGLAFGGASVGITTSANTGRYTKIGRQVTVTGNLTLSAKGSSTGVALITGLPFTIASGNQSYSAASIRLNAITYTGAFQSIGLISTASFNFEEISVLGSVSSMTDSNFSNSSSVIFSFTYTV